MAARGCGGPLVTIAIPTFNRAGSYLPRALASACHQTYGNLDILVADNASSDCTEDVVRAVGDRRVRYYRHPENIGSARNMNFCIDSSRGEYTLLLNDDDVIDESFVAACMNALPAGKRPGLIRTGARIIDELGVTIRSHQNHVEGLGFSDFVIGWIEGLTTPYLCGTLFRTDALKQVGMHSRHYLWDDVIAQLKIAAAHGRCDIVEVHASFCEHSGELTHSASARAWSEDSRELLEVVCQLAPRDSAYLRPRLEHFLAELGYRRAIYTNASVGARLHAGWVVYRETGVPPDAGWLWFSDPGSRVVV